MFGMNKGATGGAPMSSPRPMPNPQTSGMPMPPQGVPEPSTGGSGMFPGLSPQKRYDMAMQLLQQGMTAAQGSDSPLLAFLAPVAGAAIGGGIENKAGLAQRESLSGMDQQLLGTMANDPRAKGYLDILNNADAPDYAKAMAKDQLTKLMNPPKAKAGGGKSAGRSGYSRPPANSDALMTRLLFTSMDPQGDGGEEITPAEQARIDSVKNARTKSSSVDYNYDNGDGGADNDPLGIR